MPRVLFCLPLLIICAIPILAAHSMPGHETILSQFLINLKTNLFKPLLLFFAVGLSISLLKVRLDFPHQIYQGLVIYLLLAIGWHGGEELATLELPKLIQAGGFMLVGFVCNTLIGILAYLMLRIAIPNMRRVDSAAVAAHYGSDSAGTFLTCLGTLAAAQIAFASYMPVMLAVMEIPGCLLGLYLVSKLRKAGLGKDGFMPSESSRQIIPVISGKELPIHEDLEIELEGQAGAPKGDFAAIAREVFLNPGLFLLISGITIGFISRLQGPSVVLDDDRLFVGLFQGMLCLFLLEMGMNAAKRMSDLKQSSWKFIAFGIIAPNIFAGIGLLVCRVYSAIIHQPLELGTYTLFAVLCASASYIAVPAVQRLAFPEASPTLPLAASLGVTFVYNVTIGIPFYMLLAQQLISCSS